MREIEIGKSKFEEVENFKYLEWKNWRNKTITGTKYSWKAKR